MTRVLVVDDDPDVVLLLETILIQERYDVTAVPGGRDALAELRGDLPHVVILDVQMPDMDGWQTLTEIRNDPRTSALPVILCTVKAGAQDMAQGWAIGCDGYLTKPFAIEEVSREIQSVLSRSPDERTRRREAALEGIRTSLAAG